MDYEVEGIPSPSFRHDAVADLLNRKKLLVLYTDLFCAPVTLHSVV